MLDINTFRTEQDNLFFSAETNYEQFLAISDYFTHFNTLDLLSNLDYFNNSLRKSSTCQLVEVRKWLINSWNTERILRVNTKFLETDINYFILQWSFPQIYYAAFSSTIAFFNTVGHQMTGHAAVIKRFGELIAINKYPQDIAFYCTGTKANPSFLNINCNNLQSINEFDLAQNKICQFLKTTRIQELNVKRNEKNIRSNYKTIKGVVKKKLNENEWGAISNSISNTSILSFLYRKRLKANYQNVDLFNYDGLKSKEINKCLVNIIYRINLIHECMIYKAIGFTDYQKIYLAFTKGKEIDFLDKRFQEITNFLKLNSISSSKLNC